MRIGIDLSIYGTGTLGSPVPKLVIFAGNSNMAGWLMEAADVPANLETAPDQYIWTGSAFEPLVNGVNNGELSGNGEMWGPEAEFGRQWALDNPGVPLYILQLAVPLSTLEEGWAPEGTDLTALTTEVEQALAAVPGMRVRGFMWTHGETDSDDADNAAAYASRLATLLAYVRSDLGNSNTAIVVSKTKGGGAHLATVQAAQAAVIAELRRSALINTDAYTLEDSVHYDVASNIQLGEDFYNAMLAAEASDSTAPTLSSATGEEDGATEADLSVSTNEGNGRLYWVVTQSSTAPTATQIKAGQNHAGAAADDAGDQVGIATGVQNAVATGLVAETTYYAHFVHEDKYGNQSNVASSASFTTASGVYNPATALGSKLKAWWDHSDTSTLWQDTGGTTPADADEDEVLRVDDKSGNGKHKLSVTGEAPLFRNNGSNPRLVYDGSDNYMAVASAAFPLNGLQYFVVCQPKREAFGIHYLAHFSSTTGDGPSDEMALIAYSDASFSQSYTLRNSGNLDSATLAFEHPTSPIQRLEAYIENGVSARVRSNEGLTPTDDTDFETMDATHSGRFVEGARWFYDSYTANILADIHEVLIVSGADAGEIDDIRAYLDAKWGLS